ncbi:MAG TPA: hypothetical protein VMB72_04285, partial [Acidimicrobiales bacterium]|nr:hypothetical protein [Acidimicrobiales bacterium]
MTRMEDDLRHVPGATRPDGAGPGDDRSHTAPPGARPGPDAGHERGHGASARPWRLTRRGVVVAAAGAAVVVGAAAVLGVGLGGSG